MRSHQRSRKLPSAAAEEGFCTGNDENHPTSRQCEYCKIGSHQGSRRFQALPLRTDAAQISRRTIESHCPVLELPAAEHRALSMSCRARIVFWVPSRHSFVLQFVCHMYPKQHAPLSRDCQPEFRREISINYTQQER